jgi:hypothetical protein
VSQIISRHPCLTDLRNDLAAELGVRLFSPAIMRLLDILTVAVATWYAGSAAVSLKPVGSGW